MTAWQAPPEVLALRQTFAEFVDFADHCWRAIGLPPLTPRQREIAYHMQHGTGSDFIAAFRGIGKSFLASCFGVWCLFQDPAEQILVLSGAEKKAIEVSEFARQLVSHPNLPFLHHLAPKPGQRDSKLAWDVGVAPLQQAPSFQAVPVGGAQQGQRGTRAILDDIEQKNNSGSLAERGKLLTRAMDVAMQVKPESGGRVLVLGTFQSLSSIYLTMIAERGFTPFYVPARVPQKVEDYGGHLSPGIMQMWREGRIGEPTEPHRFPEEVLVRTQLRTGKLEFQIQMMLDPRVDDRLAYPLALSDLIVWDGVSPVAAPQKIIPGHGDGCRISELACAGLPGDAFYKPSFVDQKEMLPYTTIIMALDPASDAGADETAYAILAAVPGCLYLLASGGYVAGTSKTTLEALAQLARRWRVREVLIEKNLVGWSTLFQRHLHAVHRCAVTEIHHHSNKVLRIANSLEPVMRAGQLVVARSVFESEWQDTLKSSEPGKAQARLLQTQIALLRRAEKGGGLEFDDRVDALAMGVAHLTEDFLITETEAAARRMVEDREEKMIDDWLAGITDRRRQPEDLVWVDPRGRWA